MIPPTEATRKTEAAIVVQEEMIKEYIDNFKSQNEYASLLTERESEGRRKLSERVRRGEIIVSYTDKDSRVIVNKPSTFITAVEVHLNKDRKIDWSEVDPSTKLMNRTARALARMFRIGEDGTSGQQLRITQAITTSDTSPRTVSFKWKTHKN